MGLPQLNTCCFVFDLKTGNIIMGCFNAVLSFILMVIMIVELTVEVEERQSKQTYDPEIKTGMEQYETAIALILLFLAKFCYDVAFVYGVITERVRFIRSYVIMWSVFFTISILIFFMDILNFNLSTVCTELFYIAFNVYVLLLICSFYKQLNMREEV